MDEILKSQEDTILSKVNEIFRAKELKCPIEKKIKETETEISVLTDYEKAIYLAFQELVDVQNENVDLLREGKIERWKVLISTRNCQALDVLLWASIKERLGEIAFKTDAIGIRSDWKIVSYTDTEEECDMSIHIIGIGLHSTE